MLTDRQPTTEADMVATFLRAELDSPRYGDAIRGLLADDRRSDALIRNPDLANETENAHRRALLSRYRGYGRDTALFHGFPTDIVWYRAKASVDDLRAVRYINWDYWLYLSGGSRSPVDAARHVREEGEDLAAFAPLVHAIRDGEKLPELILVGDANCTGLVVLEGHTRLTAYILAGEDAPAAVDVIVGCSSRVEEWRLY